MELAAKVLTVSDGVVAGTREDEGGTAVVERLEQAGFEVVEHRVTSDGVDEVANALTYMAYGFLGVIVTTGGTGFGPRDLTPEATKRILDRTAPGMAEAMRTVNPLGRLSRNIAGVRGRALILNTPGSPKGAVEMLEAVLDVLPHAVELMEGAHPPHPVD
jgi:molybdenum cofactor synthesis domain-containing protein